jgi:hypothetical protein
LVEKVGVGLRHAFEVGESEFVRDDGSPAVRAEQDRRAQDAFGMVR